LARIGFEFGDARVLTWLGLLLAILVARRRRRWYPIIAYLMVWTAHSALVEGLKFWAGRGRPDTNVPALHGVAGGTSFPSGHSASAIVYFALAGVFLSALTGRPEWKRRMAITAAVVAFLVTASIFYLGYHWVTDVVAGTAIGAAEWLILGPLLRPRLIIQA
jgi:undecaprenyl-diphosphatase